MWQIKEKIILNESINMQWKRYRKGEIWWGDSLTKMRRMHPKTIDLCFTSPPFPLIRKKGYGNKDESAYVDWLLEFACEIKRLLKDTGSLVLDLGSCWKKGRPIRSTYDLRLTLRLIDELGLNLAQEFYWYNPSRLPSPAQWVTIEKTRVKDSINKLLWFSKSDNPKADNRRVLQPYSDSMEKIFSKEKMSHKKRPSGHQPSKKFLIRNKGSIPGNLLALSNANNSDPYLIYCKDLDLDPHPARFPIQLPEFFIRFLTETGDKILDPFAGSCTTGYAAEINDRRWICIEEDENYLITSEGHFLNGKKTIDTSGEIKLPRLGVYAIS